MPLWPGLRSVPIAKLKRFSRLGVICVLRRIIGDPGIDQCTLPMEKCEHVLTVQHFLYELLNGRLYRATA